MYWMHWKSEKNRNEPNELNELKYSKSLNQLCSLTCSCICMLRHVSKHLFIPFKIKKKDWAKWAKWARILKNTLTDEQLCSLTCFLVFACSDKYQNIYSFFRFKIRLRIELNELNKLEYSKAPSTMSSYTQEHAHAQSNINTLLYWS